MESLFPQSTFSLKHPHGTEKYHYTERFLILKHFKDASEIIKSIKMLWKQHDLFQTVHFVMVGSIRREQFSRRWYSE